MKLRTWLIGAALLAGLSINAADKEARKERQEKRAVRAEKRETKADIDNRVTAINRLDNNKAAQMAGMAAASKETAVPLPTIQAEHKDHPGIGLAGLAVAHHLAVRTHKPVDHFIKAHKEGRSWESLAKANGVSLDDVEGQLNRIEEAMRNAK